MRQGWVDKKLIEIADVSTGKYDANHANKNGKYRFYTCAYNYGMCNTNRFSGESLILPGNGVNVGEVFYYNGEFDAYQRTYVINKIKIFPKYLYYHMLLFWKELGTKLQYGSATNFIKIGNFQNYDVSYPQLPEQQRIVAILDTAFVAIAKAKANAEQNLKNAKELFESYLQNVFETKGEGWEEVTLSELAKDITDGDHMPPPKTEEGYPFITISNINKQSHQIDFSDTFKVSKEYFQKLKENRKPKNGDVLYTVTGSYGIPVLIVDDFEFCFQRHIGLIRPKENVSSKWLYYWILSPQAFFQANDTATGTAQKTVSLTALRNFKLPKISLKEQLTIVQKLDALSTETKKLEAIYQQKINDLEELKKSILQKAFAGELKTEKAVAL